MLGILLMAHKFAIAAPKICQVYAWSKFVKYTKKEYIFIKVAASLPLT